MRQNLQLGRRDFFQVKAAAGLVAAALIAAQPSETVAEVLPQPMPMPGGDMTASDILIETLIGWDATHVFVAELTTAVANKLAVKIMILKKNCNTQPRITADDAG